MMMIVLMFRLKEVKVTKKDINENQDKYVVKSVVCRTSKTGEIMVVIAIGKILKHV